MSSATLARPRASRAAVDDARLHIELADGRELSVPIEWFDWLANATDEQKQRITIIGGGIGLWWDELEDGISVPMLMGLPADS